jgi:hypothetical protein
MRPTTRNNALLWTVQGLLALLFLFAGVTKLLMPIEALTADSNLPGAFLRFIGVAEAAGAVGLILPALLNIRPVLTPLAAAGLVIIMTGATVISLPLGVAAAFPGVTGILCGIVAFGRWNLLPDRGVLIGTRRPGTNSQPLVS